MPDLDWNEIADRFFSVYADKPQAEIVRQYETTRAQVSRWNARKEKLPLKVLAKLVSLENVTWDWIMAGVGPMKRRQPSVPPPPAKKKRIPRPKKEDGA